MKALLIIFLAIALGAFVQAQTNGQGSLGTSVNTGQGSLDSKRFNGTGFISPDNQGGKGSLKENPTSGKGGLKSKKEEGKGSLAENKNKGTGSLKDKIVLFKPKHIPKKELVQEQIIIYSIPMITYTPPAKVNVLDSIYFIIPACGSVRVDIPLNWYFTGSDTRTPNSFLRVIMADGSSFIVDERAGGKANVHLERKINNDGAFSYFVYQNLSGQDLKYTVFIKPYSAI